MTQSTEQLDDTRDRTGTRSELVAAARTLFGRQGYDGTSVRAIVGLAGTNLGAVTYHFGTKRDLYNAVLREGIGSLEARVTEAVISDDGDARQRMVRIVEAYFRHFEEHPDLPHLLLQEVAAGKPPPAIVRETLGRLKQTIGRLAACGATEGSIRPGHPVLTALSVVAQPVFLTLVAPLLRSVGDIDLADPAMRERARRHCTEFVWAALAPEACEAP
ncbi:MAG: TetR/AcrR family transcriptional regulator [Gammaproteobacteria bacterium]|nr:TetR/AcrR family transcriptional regulator [Gammaproteobacteria bacterium]MDE0247509.1 TetR/AcrR family transcriptional regulator [Gammaproteobacteria bacterium]